MESYEFIFDIIVDGELDVCVYGYHSSVIHLGHYVDSLMTSEIVVSCLRVTSSIDDDSFYPDKRMVPFQVTKV